MNVIDIQSDVNFFWSVLPVPDNRNKSLSASRQKEFFRHLGEIINLKSEQKI